MLKLFPLIDDQPVSLAQRLDFKFIFTHSRHKTAGFKPGCFDKRFAGSGHRGDDIGLFNRLLGAAHYSHSPAVGKFRRQALRFFCF